MEELHCMAQLNAGDEKAFQYIFGLFYERLCFFARGVTQTDLQVDDLVQDAFVQLWKHRDGFDSFRSVKAFLYTAVKNGGRNLLKHNKVVLKHARTQKDLPLEEAVLHRIVEAEVLADVRRALDQLPEGCRTVIRLCYFQGLRNQEAASQLQVSVNTVKTQKVRALRMLRLSLRHFLYFLLFLSACHPFYPFGCF